MTAQGRKMTGDDWRLVRHFKAAEFGHDPARADAGLVMLLDQMRSVGKAPVNIHVCWSDSDDHKPLSLHRVGAAVDFHFGTGLTYLEQMVLVLSFPFGGIGFYPDWKNPGWHVDVRGACPKILWSRSKNGDYLAGFGAMAQAVWAKHHQASQDRF